MCARSNTNLLKRNAERYKKQRKKEFWKDIRNIVKMAFPALAYGVLFALQAIIDDSVRFSVALALFSICVTVAFEANEWVIFYNSIHKQKKTEFNYSYPLLFALVLLIVLLFAYDGVIRILTLFGISEDAFGKFPNIISSITLFGYFVSYIFRQIKIRVYQYRNGNKNI